MARELTATAILRDAVDQWRRGNHWSRETAAQVIVEAHERIDGPLVTGIAFCPPTTDPYERMRVNADRVFRWLDDVTKDRNLLPVNLLASVLAALPMAVRRQTADRLLRPAGLVSTPLADAAASALPAPDLRQAVGALLRREIMETAEANAAIAGLIDGATNEELVHARQQIAEAIEALQTALGVVAAAMSIPCEEVKP